MIFGGFELILCFWFFANQPTVGELAGKYLVLAVGVSDM